MIGAGGSMTRSSSFCGGDHPPQQLVHSVGVHSCAVRNTSRPGTLCLG
jgi:hypothetical protein